MNRITPLAFVLCSALALVALTRAAPAAAAPCRALDYSFSPDCFRASGDAACAWNEAKPDLGPQIAVWVESADRTRFVDTLMVTNATALFGIGNRPGLPNLRSGPKFPYGRRPMALPVWAFARGKTYPLVVMQDGQEGLLTYHEGDSSPEPHFCRPMLPDEEVDAVTCPSATFRSDKGRLDPTQVSVYPPRGDLLDLGAVCPALVNRPGGSCNAGDSKQYAFLDDVDVVATATPPAGAVVRGEWLLPAGLPPGDYALLVEVAKEFDTNAAYDAADAPSLDYDTFGTAGNLGQPSVVYRVPFTVGAGGPSAGADGAGASATEPLGHGDATGATGTIFPPDATIADAPGSGAGRLATIDGAGGPGRVHLSFDACAPVDCASEGPPRAVPISVVAAALTSTAAAVRVEQVAEPDATGAPGGPVLAYDVRLAPIPDDGFANIAPASFTSWTPVSPPAPAAAGTVDQIALSGLMPGVTYAVGVVARGDCGTSPVSFARFTTPVPKSAKLTGCFIATAAFGSDVEPEVDALRRLRDRAVAASPLARLAADIYYRTAPAAARVLRDSEAGRAVVRVPLRPLARVAGLAAP